MPRVGLTLSTPGLHCPCSTYIVGGPRGLLFLISEVTSEVKVAAAPFHPSVCRIIELLDKDDGTGELYWEGDLSHMHQVSKYIDCHRALLREAGAAAAGGGGGEEEAERLRHRLMNYGFDPHKEQREEAGAHHAAGA